MNRIDIQQETGFPVNKKTFEFMQNAYTQAIRNLSLTFGNNLILHGVELSGTQRTDGAIVYNGELIPFVSSPDAEYIVIEEQVENAVYQSQQAIPAYFTKTARCSEVMLPGAFPLSDLKRVNKTGLLRDETEWTDCILGPNTVIERSYYSSDIEVPFSPELQVKIDAQGNCWIKGHFYNVEKGGVICTLPVQFRPKRKVYVKLLAFSIAVDAEYSSYLAEINTNGELIAPTYSLNSTNCISLEKFSLD